MIHSLTLVDFEFVEQSWLHFYSNWIIANSTIDPETWIIQVNLNEVGSDLNFEDHIGCNFT